MTNVSALHNKRILVTGARGFIGTNLTRTLAQVPCHLTRVSRHPMIALRHNTCTMQDVCIDLRDVCLPLDVVQETDIIFHLAAQTSAVAANASPANDYALNVRPLVSLIHQCCEYGFHPIIVLAGTVTQFGHATRLPVDESHIDSPETVYDLHKCHAERYLEYFSHSGAVSGVTLRLPTVFGPGVHTQSPDRGVINRTISRALAGEPVTIWGSGNWRRDYLYVEDATRAFIAAAACSDSLRGGHYLVSSGESRTICEVFHAIAKRTSERTGRNVPVFKIRPPDGELDITFRDFVGDGRRFCELTGWKPEVSFDHGLDLTIESLLQDWPYSSSTQS